jgi:hypothetical protein
MNAKSLHICSFFFPYSSFLAGAAVPHRPPNAPRFRGVTKHKRTQRYEAHIWECKKQIYLGGFDSEILAAKSHGKIKKMKKFLLFIFQPPPFFLYIYIYKLSKFLSFHTFM